MRLAKSRVSEQEMGLGNLVFLLDLHLHLALLLWDPLESCGCFSGRWRHVPMWGEMGTAQQDSPHSFWDEGFSL